MINAGELKHRITIEKLKETKSSLKGFQDDIYEPYKKIWTKKNNLFGREYWSAKAVQSENIVIYEMRYSKDLEEINTKKFRINDNGRYFNIVHIDNILYENKVLKIKAIETI